MKNHVLGLLIATVISAVIAGVVVYGIGLYAGNMVSMDMFIAAFAITCVVVLITIPISKTLSKFD